MNTRLAPIIALTGPAGSGKNYAARKLVELTGVMFGLECVAFADLLKDSVARMLGRTRWNDDLKTARHLGVTGRRWLQLMGDAARAVDPEVFVNDMHRRVAAINRGTAVIITDLRFPNEADWVHAQSGVVVRVCRPGNLTGAEATHISEVPLHANLVDYYLRDADQEWPEILDNMGYPVPR